MRPLPNDIDLQAIQTNFHQVILGRVADLIQKHQVDLPTLSFPLNSKNEKLWFPIPGMYGGFSYWFEQEDKVIKLICESWSRVVGGSGQRHEITEDNFQLVDERFV